MKHRADEVVILRNVMGHSDIWRQVLRVIFLGTSNRCRLQGALLEAEI